jgi:hypothetical protein
VRITVAARSKAWNIFARSKAGIVGSNPTQGMDVCLCLFCVCIGSGLAMGWSPVQGVPPTVLGLRNWSETKRFADAVCSKVGATGKREREIATLSTTNQKWIGQELNPVRSLTLIVSDKPHNCVLLDACFLFLICLACSSILKMTAISSSETPADF